MHPAVSLSVDFNQAFNAASLSAGSFALVANGIPVAFSVTAGTLSGVLTPKSPLTVGTRYEVTVKAGIVAQNGTVLAADYKLGFTTAPAAFRSVVLAPQTRDLIRAFPPLVAAGDLNGDGRTDVLQMDGLPAGLPGNTVGYSLRLFMQGADGSFSLMQQVNTVTGTGSQMTFPRVFITDVDGDGIPDIVVPEFTLEGLRGTIPGEQVSGIRIYKRTGAGLYASSSFVRTTHTEFMTMLDVDGDGRPDFIGTNLYEPGFQVILNTSSGLAPSDAVSDMYCSCEFALTDLNHDGKRQLVVNNAGQILQPTLFSVLPSISVYSVESSGKLTQDLAQTSAMSKLCFGYYRCTSMVVLDINGDGWTDLLFADAPSLTDGSVGAVPYFRQAAGGYAQGSPFTLGVNKPVIIPADMNRDGVLDLVEINAVFGAQGGANIAAVLFTQGTSTFRFSPAYVIPHSESLELGAVAIADINGDGALDIVLVGGNLGVSAMLQYK